MIKLHYKIDGQVRFIEVGSESLKELVKEGANQLRPILEERGIPHEFLVQRIAISTVRDLLPKGEVNLGSFGSKEIEKPADSIADLLPAEALDEKGREQWDLFRLGDSPDVGESSERS